MEAYKLVKTSSKWLLFLQYRSKEFFGKNAADDADIHKKNTCGDKWLKEVYSTKLLQSRLLLVVCESLLKL